MITFQGTELRSIECTGTFSLEHARKLVPQELMLEQRDNRAVVGLLYFQMYKLSAFGFGWPAFSYQELLWRVGIVIGGEPAWFGLCGELDDSLVQKSAEAMFQYTTERASFFIEGETHIKISGRETTQIETTNIAPIEQPPPRRMLVERDQKLYEVYWREKPAKEAMRAEIKLTTTRALDDLRWERDGVCLQGRTHICGIAKKR